MQPNSAAEVVTRCAKASCKSVLDRWTELTAYGILFRFFQMKRVLISNAEP